MYCGAVFFWDLFILFTHFYEFWSQIGVVILITPKQEVERKSERFSGVKLFRSIVKVEWENGVWTKICSLVVFCSHSIFWIRFFNGFCYPFLVQSRPSFFVWTTNFHFSLVVFLFTCGVLKLIFLFIIFWSVFFRNCFPNSFVVGPMYSYLSSQWKFFELYFSTCPATFYNSL